MGAYDYLTIAEVAQKNGLSQSYVSRLCRSGALYGAIKVGKTWLIPIETAESQFKNNHSLAGAVGPGRMKKAIRCARGYGVAYVDRHFVKHLEEWRGMDYPAFCQALANADNPAFFTPPERAECVQYFSEEERVLFDEADGDAGLYNAAVNAAWREAQCLLA